MGPGQTTPGKSNSTTTLSIGNERARERDTEKERERERERDREREESLHFTEKAFVSSEYFTEMRNRGLGVSFSPEIKDERRRKGKEKQKGKRGVSVGLCSPTKFIPLVCFGCLSHKHA